MNRVSVQEFNSNMTLRRRNSLFGPLTKKKHGNFRLRGSVGNKNSKFSTAKKSRLLQMKSHVSISVIKSLRISNFLICTNVISRDTFQESRIIFLLWSNVIERQELLAAIIIDRK